MASRKTEDLHSYLVQAYQKAKAEFQQLYPQDPQPFITCTYRSSEEQNELYAKGRTKPGKKVTNAKGGQSVHNYLPSYAFDIAFITLGSELDWSQGLFKKFSDIILKDPLIEWGGNWRFKDPPHFQFKDYSYTEARDNKNPLTA